LRYEDQPIIADVLKKALDKFTDQSEIYYFINDVYEITDDKDIYEFWITGNKANVEKMRSHVDKFLLELVLSKVFDVMNENSDELYD